MIRPSFVLKVGHTKMSRFQTTEHQQSPSDWFACGFLYLYGWETDENMDSDDAMFILEPALDKSILTRQCPVYDCTFVSEHGATMLLDHLNRHHYWSIHLLTGWLYRQESPLQLDLKEGHPVPDTH